MINKHKLCSIILISIIMGLILFCTPAISVVTNSVFRDTASVNFTIQVSISPVLTLQKLASQSSFSGIKQNITYVYTVTNSGFGNFDGNITVEDNKIGIFNISYVDIAPGQNITLKANYTITQPDVDAGYVTNTAYAVGIFNVTNVDINSGKNVKGTAKYTTTQSDLDGSSVTNKVYSTGNFINSNDVNATVIFLILPLANFSTNVTNGYDPLSVQFTDLSKNATKWSWSFGDGVNSNQKDPTHTFTAGNYIVNETVSNTNGTNSMLATINVITKNPQNIPTVIWNNPANIVYGTPLSSIQLNATASVPGTFVYIPPLGTVLDKGTQTLSTTFTPTDSVNYTTASATVLTTVVPEKPSITSELPSIIYKSTKNDIDKKVDLFNGGYDDSKIPLPLYASPIHGSPIYGSLIYGNPIYGNKLPLIGSENSGKANSGTTEVPNSNSHGFKANISSLKCSKTKLIGSKVNASLSKNKQKNRSKHHKAQKNRPKNHKVINYSKNHKAEKKSSIVK